MTKVAQNVCCHFDRSVERIQLIFLLRRLRRLILEVDLSALILRIIPDEDLPYQIFRERQLRQENLAALKEKKAEKKKVDLPFIAKPYKLFGMPSIDFQTQAGYDARRDSSVYQFGFNGVQDLAFASAEYTGRYPRPRPLRRGESSRLSRRRPRSARRC